MSDKKRTLVLIDGHANVHKAYHALREATLTSPSGEPTSAIYTFLTVFLRMRKLIGFDHVIVVFDPPGTNFREEMYPEYKAHRPPTPPELKQQDQRIRELLAHMRVPVVVIPGCEADDTLASYARLAVESGGEALVCSVDKDLLQIVKPGIKIWRDHLSKLEVMEEANVVDKLGVRPDQVAAYLGLVGDTSDNIPGVPGVGAKTAASLLQQYGTMEAILAAAPTMKQKKLSENLVNHAEDARLSQRLATLNDHCVETFDWEQARWEFQVTPGFTEFLREMGFYSILKELGAGATVAPNPTKSKPRPKPVDDGDLFSGSEESEDEDSGDEEGSPAATPSSMPTAPVEHREVSYAVIRTVEELSAATAEIRTAGRCAIDTETTDIDPLTADLVGISLSWRPNQAAYIPLGHGSDAAQLTLMQAREGLASILSDEAIQWQAHHWNYDYKVLKNHGFVLPKLADDTMVAGYLALPDGQMSLRLKELALLQLGIRMTEISELIGDGTDFITMASVSVEDSARYACQDADCTLQLADRFSPRIDQAGVRNLYRDVELPLVTVLAEMELEGVRIDPEHFKKLSLQAEKDLDVMTREIYAIAGHPFKINSPKQVADLLFNELKLPTDRKGKSGTPSTDVSVLEGLKSMHPLPAKLLDFRQVEKLKNTYLDTLPTMIHAKTGRVHTNYSQTVAATGRLSSNNPNLQNIPIRTDAGRQIRAGFIPREGWRFLSADYSQIELRILAHLSNDEALREAFRTGGDIHTLTASKVFGVPLEEVASSQRSAAKAINFGIIYGMSDFRLSRDLDVPRAKAKQFIEDYFRIYSGVKNFIESTKEAVRRDRYVTTLLGRRRYLPDIKSSNFNKRSAAERMAVNTPIQGTSADMIKVAMVRLHERLRRDNFRARMILQVHDELIFDAPEDELDRLSGVVREEMAGALDLDVPIRVDVETGVNWAEC